MMYASLLLASVNIERRKHLDLVRAFLRTQNPDVVCFQEINDGTVTLLKAEFQMHGVFVPRVVVRDEPGIEGIAVLSKYPITQASAARYDAALPQLQPLKHLHLYRPGAWLQLVEIEKDGQRFQLANTHFTWADKGDVTDEQRANMEKLLALTTPLSPLVLVGDFNTPRGKELYTALSGQFTDNIPASVQTTIDGAWHRAGSLQLVVDGMFSKGYQVRDVQVLDGVSDHCAVLGTVRLM